MMANISLAFEQLNLRWNPFGEPAPADIADLAVVDVEANVSRLRRPGFALHPDYGIAITSKGYRLGI